MKQRVNKSGACPLCQCLPYYYQSADRKTTFAMCENPACLLYQHPCFMLTWVKMCAGTMRSLLMPKELSGLLYRGEKTLCLQPVESNLVDVTSMGMRHDRKGWYCVPHFGAQNAKQPPERRYYATNQPGDILYVREPYWCGHPLDENGNIQMHVTKTWFAADGENPTPYDRFVHPKTGQLVDSTPFWRSGSTMPREQARTFLLVRSLRLQRMQELSDDDIARQGCKSAISASSKDKVYWVDVNGVVTDNDSCVSSKDKVYWVGDVPSTAVPVASTMQEAWQQFCLWRFGRAAWEQNAWCWVYDVVSLRYLQEDVK